MNKILINKGLIRNEKDGSTVVNMPEKSFDFGLDRLVIDRFYKVSKTMEMRSDLFATIYGNTPDDEWVILKYNGISNPFILKEGDFLAMPNMDNVRKKYSTPKTRSLENPKSTEAKETIREQFKELINFSDRETPNKNTFDNFKDKYKKMEEDRRKAAIDRLRNSSTGDTSPTDDLLPPNFTDGAGSEFTILDNGEVILGTSVADTDETCAKKTTTKAELINALIKNRVVR